MEEFGLMVVRGALASIPGGAATSHPPQSLLFHLPCFTKCPAVPTANVSVKI